jgi:DNA-binding NarL/FixJ family response regulator
VNVCALLCNREERRLWRQTVRGEVFLSGFLSRRKMNQHCLPGLDGEERRIIDLRLQGQSNTEIAATLHRTHRWVRKLVERMRDRWGRDLEEGGS